MSVGYKKIANFANWIQKFLSESWQSVVGKNKEVHQMILGGGGELQNSRNDPIENARNSPNDFAEKSYEIRQVISRTKI